MKKSELKTTLDCMPDENKRDCLRKLCLLLIESIDRYDEADELVLAEYEVNLEMVSETIAAIRRK